MTAHDVMVEAASVFLNDSAQSTFTDIVLLPHLKFAWGELREILEENNVPATNQTTSEPLVITTEMFSIGGFEIDCGPALPTDLIEVQALWERLSGSDEEYTLMEKREFLPKDMIVTSSLIYWAWLNQEIKFIGANTDRDVKIDYVGKGFGDITGANTVISMINSKTFLSTRTAGLAARFIGENPTRADSLDGDALMALERTVNISTKGRQLIATRRRPFRAAYRNRGY